MEIEEAIEITIVEMGEIFNRRRNIFLIQDPLNKVDKIEVFLKTNNGNIICSRNSKYLNVLQEERVYLRYGEVLKKRLTIPDSYIFYDFYKHHYNREKFSELASSCKDNSLIVTNCSISIISHTSFDYIIFTDNCFAKDIYDELFGPDEGITFEDFSSILNNVIEDGSMLAIKIDPECIEFLMIN